jgi:hypothetical protein
MHTPFELTMNNKTILSSKKSTTPPEKKVFSLSSWDYLIIIFKKKKVERRFVSFHRLKNQASYCKSANHRLFSAPMI